MQRLLSCAILILTFFAIPAFAQDILNETPNQSASGKVMSPADFKKAVDTVNKQSQQQLKDKLNQQLSNKPAMTPQTPSTPPGPAIGGGQAPGPVIGKPAQTPAAPEPLPPPSLSAPSQAPAAQPTPPAPISSQNTSITNAPSNGQSQGYSGFQGQQQNQAPAGQQGGGLNINY